MVRSDNYSFLINLCQIGKKSIKRKTSTEEKEDKNRYVPSVSQPFAETRKINESKGQPIHKTNKNGIRNKSSINSSKYITGSIRSDVMENHLTITTKASIKDGTSFETLTIPPE